jgi:hypothetical protein
MSIYMNLGSDAEERLEGAIALLQKEMQDGTISSVTEFFDNYPQFEKDLNPDRITDVTLLATQNANNKKIVKQIYDLFVKNDIQRLAGLYANNKYPTGPNDPLINSSKKDIIIGFFDGPQDDIIAMALKMQNGTSGGNYTAKTTNLRRHAEILFEIQGLLNTSSAGIGNASIENIFDDFGFDDWLKDQDELSLITSDELSGAAALAAVTASDTAKLETLKRAVRAIKGLPPPGELTDEDERNVNQCALISDLLHKGLSYKVYPQIWNKGADGDNPAFNGRIYPVTLQDFNPDSLVNICTIPTTIKSFFSDETTVESMKWNLFWVFQDKNGIHEELIFKTNTTTTGEFSDKITDLATKKFLDRETVRELPDKISNNMLGYTIKKATITYDGTNPSTARNDVKVDLEISLASLRALKATCCYVALTTDKDGDANTKGDIISERVEIKVSDLVGGTQGNTYESQQIALTTFKREFVPDFSRLRLKAFSGIDALKNCDLILDITTIKHTLSTPSSTGETTLTINYRGYFEQAMNMPYNDALADTTLINARLARNEKIKKARDQKCSDKLIREIARVNQEQERLEVESFHKKGGLIKRMYTRKLIYSYRLDDNALSQGQNGNILDPRLNYVKNIISDPNAQFVNYNQKNYAIWAASAKEDASLLADAAGLVGIDDDVFREEDTTARIDKINKLYKGKCFFLGDLMDVLLDCLYEDNTANHRTQAKGMNLRFIMGTVRVPDPTDLDNFMTINPLQIPIDMGFFAAWYHDTIIKKGITHYPVGAFMKDLIERLINDVIYDTCFSILLPDEQPPQLRTTFFTDCDPQNRWFKTYQPSAAWVARGTFIPGTWFDPLNPYVDAGGFRSVANKPNILMKKDASVDIAKCKNYCVIYQQSPSYFRQLKAQNSFSLKNDPYCPTMYYGYNMKNHNYLTNVALTTSTATYLTEARFFSSQLGNLSLMSNIYDVSFDIKQKKLNTMFHPGNILNLIVTDFEGGATERWSSMDEIKIDESNPHKKGTLANTLGIGGYHIVKSVTYTLNNDESLNLTVNVSTKFTGTDAVGDSEKPSPKTPYAEEQESCITQYNNALNDLRITETATGLEAADMDRIYETGVADNANPTTTTRSGQTTRATGVAIDPTAAEKAAEATAQTVLAATAKQNALAVAGTPSRAIQDKLSIYASQYKVGTSINGATVDAVLFKDKFLEVKSVTPTTNGVDIVYNEITYDNKGKPTVGVSYTVTHISEVP